MGTVEGENAQEGVLDGWWNEVVVVSQLF